MKKKRKLKKKVVVIILLISLLLILGTGFVLYDNIFKKSNSSSKVINEIPEYGYTLKEKDPKIYKDLFEKLVVVLKKENVDYKEYANIISQMFVIDFYNLDNKISKNDVGGIQFLREKNASNFVLEASETVYKFVEQNVYGDRRQKLPVVKESKVISLENEKYKYGNIVDDEAYVAKIGVSYKKDLGYPDEVTVKLIREDKKLVVVEMK